MSTIISAPALAACDPHRFAFSPPDFLTLRFHSTSGEFYFKEHNRYKSDPFAPGKPYIWDRSTCDLNKAMTHEGFARLSKWDGTNSGDVDGLERVLNYLNLEGFSVIDAYWDEPSYAKVYFLRRW
ncbi:hypothetical protein HDU85_002351 [Gaertneriomyces sp. JEL0708]|nr:hypothetical protein HDU85_002351 [Gaertneriomyces sp. JEL0708]